MTSDGPAGPGGAGLPVLLALAGLLAVLPAPSPASAPGPPPVHLDDPPAGHTGGFGEDDCTVCHLDAGPNLPGGSLEVVGLPAEYRASARYELEVILRAEGTVRAGFQLAARHPDGSQAGDLQPLDGRVQVLAPDTLRARYAAQTRAGSEPLSSEEARWTVVWTAPGGGGPVRFHAAANSANGDESPLGDLVYTVEASSHRAPGS